MRQELILKMAKALEGIKPQEIVLVAIDGIDASGKTSFSNELKDQITKRPVIQLSLDHFHNPKEYRVKRGQLSPEGYYYDSFNYTFIQKEILEPLKNGKDNIPTQYFDYRTEEKMLPKTVVIPYNAIVLFDGVFMMRERLINYWDVKIFLEITFDEALRRGLRRDIHHYKDQKQLIEKYNRRYLPGQSIYLLEEQPKAHADIIIDHNNFSIPTIIKWSLKETYDNID